MGIDYRPDHSFRVPRPDLSQNIGVPNACNRCHIDETDQWSVDNIIKWYGQKHKPHYGTILYAGRKGLAETDKDLIRLADDRLFPAVVRATALSLLGRYPGQQSTDALERALSDEQALVRHSAVRHLVSPNPDKRLQLVAPLLYDPVKAVRIEAARSLAEIPSEKMSGATKKVHESVLDEYRRAMEYTADFASSRHNLAILYSNLGQLETAERNYKKAIEIDGLFYPAKVNLAMFYNQQGRNTEAEKLLREVVEAHPALHEVKYSLGLLLAEEKKYEEAAKYLAAATRGMPERARVHYNLGLLLAHLQRDQQAEMALLQALEIEPENMNFLYALAEFYLKRNRMTEAKLVAEQMIAKHPQNKLGRDLLNYINERLPQ
jgi:tetratricopeptide (TPR) repeat protein